MEGRFNDLEKVIQRIPLVDAHAHNIVALDSDLQFIRCFTGAEGEALNDATHTLSFKRSIREIASLYGCEASLEGVQQYRELSGLKAICAKALKAANVSAVFIDDGIIFNKMHDIEWHRTYVPIVGRILRIEHLAEQILEEGLQSGRKWTLESFSNIFLTMLKEAATKVVSFKSIAAYRSSLQIDTRVCKKNAEYGLLNDLGNRPVRIQNKSFIGYIFTCSLGVALSFDLPIQIHTGFGDKDLDLSLSNPLHLRPLLEDERFTQCRIVLLHASYPFSREASYLASIYPNVYLDFGLAIPKLSVHGMVSSVKQLLHLAPLKKVMFSSDGYAFPETFFLGAKQARNVLPTVLNDACEDGDLTLSEAIDAAKAILRHNALEFYKTAQKNESFESICSLYQPHLPVNQASQGHPVFVRIVWVDTSGQHRCRAIPGKRFYKVVKDHGVGLTRASMGMTSHCDGPAEGSNLTAVGEVRLIPDLTTKCKLPWSEREEMVLADMHVEPGQAWKYCPREVLRRISRVLKQEFNLEMNAGFESEFFLLRNTLRDGKEVFSTFDSTPYCSTSAFDAAYPILKEISDSLSAMEISVEQIHAEAGKGQFEIALGHTMSIQSADSLIWTREAIRAVARKHGLVATFLPKYFLDDVGSGSHVHLSLWQDGRNVFVPPNGSITKFGMSKTGEEFMAGVLCHLPSIMAFTAPLPNSYDRIQPNTWSGAYHCWGRENREAPIRTACPPGIEGGLVSNFEIKTFDGCANPYLGLAAIMAAGIDGLRRKLSLPEPVETNPDDLEGTIPKLPTSLEESVEALAKDEVLKIFVGEELVTAVIAVRKAEVRYYATNTDALKNLVHRY